MKKLFVLCLLFVFSTSIYAQETKAKKTTKAKTEKAVEAKEKAQAKKEAAKEKKEKAAPHSHKYFTGRASAHIHEQCTRCPIAVHT